MLRLVWLVLSLVTFVAASEFVAARKPNEKYFELFLALMISRRRVWAIVFYLTLAGRGEVRHALPASL